MDATAASTRRSPLWLKVNYTELMELGKGAQSRVLLCRNKKTQKLVAVKCAMISSGHAANMTEREARFLSSLRMKNIVHLDDWYSTTIEHILIMDPCDADLWSFMDIYQQRGKKLPELFVWRVFSRIADAIAFIHHHGVVHHDIKPGNILLKWNGRKQDRDYPDAILADFGAATQKTETCYDELRAPAYTSVYHPPDKLRGPSMDIWALGSVIHEIALGRTVVKNMPPEVKRDPLLKDIWVSNPHNRRIGRGADKVYSPLLEAAMFTCLRFDPHRRTDAKALANNVKSGWVEKRMTLKFEPLHEWCRTTIESKVAAVETVSVRGSKAMKLVGKFL